MGRLGEYVWVVAKKERAYILNAEVQTPQTILNFMQRDCWRMQKLSVSVSES